MITTAILNWIYSGLAFMLSPILSQPNASLPAGLSSAISSVSAYLSAIAAILPLTTGALLLVIGLMVTIELSIFGYKIVMWVVHRIPGQGGGSTS